MGSGEQAGSSPADLWPLLLLDARPTGTARAWKMALGSCIPWKPRSSQGPSQLLWLPPALPNFHPSGPCLPFLLTPLPGSGAPRCLDLAPVLPPSPSHQPALPGGQGLPCSALVAPCQQSHAPDPRAMPGCPPGLFPTLRLDMTPLFRVLLTSPCGLPGLLVDSLPLHTLPGPSKAWSQCCLLQAALLTPSQRSAAA